MTGLSIRRATTRQDFAHAKTLINTYHSYIRYADRPSRKLYWLLYQHDTAVGVFALGSAFARPAAVATFMQTHALQFNEVANNIVYCLAPHETPNLGTQFLARCRRDAISWWNERYEDRLKAFQTFILPPRTGAMYKADNWTLLGATTGGHTWTVRTIRESERETYPQAERRVFRSGDIRYLLRTWTTTDRKLIFMRLA